MKFTTITAASLIALAVAAAPAFAQEAEDNADSNEIIVTAQKREENLQEVQRHLPIMAARLLKMRNIWCLRSISANRVQR
jgi:iron complex outermembrane recepter protein